MTAFWRRSRERSLALAAIGLVVALSSDAAKAQTSGGNDGTDPETTAEASYGDESLSDLSQHLSGFEATNGDVQAQQTEDETLPGLSDVPTALADLPSGGTSVSPQAVALPQGASSITGMGESFTTQLSTGIVSYAVPLQLLSARGGVQARLDVSYSSAAGFGVAGHGWSLGASAISRQTDRGIPKYDDRADWHPEQDRFVFGGMELVPICTVSGTECPGKLGNEVMPSWASGWQYFRARIEGGFLRFFWSPDHRTWRVQSKDGGNFELGVPLDGSGYTGALEANPEDGSEIYRWYMVRQYDSEGNINSATPQPVNSIVYRYMNDGEAVYLTDIYDTSPAASPTSLDLTRFAHHTRIAYEARPDIARSFRTGWLIEHRLRVARVDVTSKTFLGPVTNARELVRRYHFQYETDSHNSLLLAVQMEGRCATPVAEAGGESLPATSCPRLPPLSFDYQRPAVTNQPLSDANGYLYESFNEDIQELAESPPHSLDEALTGLMDVNADGLPDVLVTAAGLYGGRHGIYFNGATSNGAIGFEGLSTMRVEQLGAIDENVIRLDNTNLAPLDLDADGIINLVHMPYDKRYSVFSPVKSGNSWMWKGRQVATASEQNVKIDFTRESPNIQVMDVNADGLVDVVYSSPTEVQTFFALGRYPGGHDQFGKAQWTSAASANISNDPVGACAPWSGMTTRFSDPDVRVGDLNGDGLPDIARIRSGQILYWPGRGNGFWGTGPREGCPAGELATNRHIEMLDAPQFGVTRPGALFLSDVNADGLADIVEVRSIGADIYLNDNGTGWTERFTIDNTPFLPSTGNYVRITDIDGSGTPDILWGRADEYRYIDLAAGKIPYLLVGTRSGTGASTELEYATTVDVMRQAKAAGTPWTTMTPTVSPLLVRSTSRDNLELVGRPAGVYVTEYSYRDPVYEGRQREFRGFREGTIKTLGDANGPTMFQRTVFQLGECSENFQGSAADVCSPSLRWQDNWREPLKGLPVVVESFNEAGVYLSTEHTKYELRQLYTGLDGRRVTVPYPVAKNTYLYDTHSFTGAPDDVTPPLIEVQANLVGITHTETGKVTKRATNGTARVRSSTLYDNYGNVTQSTREGCVEGCPEGVDETITGFSTFALAPGSDWLWRESSAYVNGSIHTAPRSQVSHTYNSKGKLLESRATLSGTLLLDRSHNQGGTIAPAPSQASGGVTAPTEIVLVNNTYDPTFGHLTFSRGPNNRCGGIATASSPASIVGFDALYAQLPISANVYVGAVNPTTLCGDRGLTNGIGAYDRGLEVPLDSTDATGQPGHFDYDEFGRVISITSANPASPGTLAPNASLEVEYFLPTDPETTPYSVTIVRALDGPDFATSSYHETWAFTDGLGRTITGLSQADPADPGDWVVAGFVEYNAKGAPTRVHEPWFYDQAAETYTFTQTPPPAPTCAQRGTTNREYDAFGRVVRAYRNDLLQASFDHHALSQDAHDRADIEAGPHQGSFSTAVSDGHGRGVRRTQRIHVGSSLEERHVLNEYLPTGEIRRVVQKRTGSTDVVRWMRYDSLGRLVLNAEPNTAQNFNTDPNTPPDNLDAWRYAYNDAGEMVGFSDARGCGANYHYDAGGRLIAEDRSPCRQFHNVYSAPNLTNGDGTEAFYRYDIADPDTGSIVDTGGQAFSINTAFLWGRLASVSGLGSKAVFSYDALGRGTGTAIRIVKPGTPATALASRYTPRWYTRYQSYDAASRVKTATSGVPPTVTQLLGTGNASQASFTYMKGGGVKTIGSSYGTLLSNVTYFADGRSDTMTLGDEADTQRAYCYDVNHRLSSVQTYRAAAPLWSNPPPPYTAPSPTGTAQLLLEDYDFSYDSVDNITAITDFRTPADWPGSFKPVSRTFEYDDLYRLTRTTYQYPGGGTDQWASPYAAENANSSRIPQPSPHVSFTNRIQEQNFQYDWLGNVQQSTDDQHGFYDRSLGNTTRGATTAGPNRLLTASNRTLAPSSPAKGDLEVGYDPAGNVNDVVIKRDGPCLPSGASCWQRFNYQWDEVGQLTRARRWDLVGNERTNNASITAAFPSGTEADLKYQYDAGGDRVLKTSGSNHTVYIFGSLELRSTPTTGGGPNLDYSLAYDKVQLRLPAGPATARVIHALESMPTLTSGQQHVFLEMRDHLGSTSFIIDHATGELVEYTTYNAYGATESDYRPARWAQFREPIKFTGKEEDIEVGLAYFGARYYSPYLTAWMSPDAVTIHDLGSDINPYAYVYGTPLMGVDPDGNNPILIGAAIAAVVNIIQQGQANGYDNIDWGFDGVLGAAVTGAVSGGVASGVGGAVGGSALTQGIAGGAAGAGASYATSVALSGQSSSLSGFGQAIILGGISGGVGGGVGGATKDAVAGAAAGAGAGFVASVAFGGDASLMALSLSLGASVAGAMAQGSPEAPDDIAAGVDGMGRAIRDSGSPGPLNAGNALYGGDIAMSLAPAYAEARAAQWNQMQACDGCERFILVHGERVINGLLLVSGTAAAVATAGLLGPELAAVILARGAPVVVVAGGAAPAVLERIAAGKSMNAAIAALNQAGATQAQAVQVLTRVVANADKNLLPGTLAGSPGTIVLSGVAAAPGGLTPAIAIAPNGFATMGSAIIQSMTRTTVVVTDFVAK